MNLLSFARMTCDLANAARERHERAGNERAAELFLDIEANAYLIIGQEVVRLNEV